MSTLKCQFCDFKYTKLGDYASHLESNHRDLLPLEIVNGYHAISFIKNGKLTKKCMICKKEVGWNNITNKYNAFCSEACKQEYIKIFEQRMIKARGVKRLTSDPEHQRKMLAGRSISNKYLHSDGVEIQYTGTYELSFLKFLDLVLEFPAVDIIGPSPHTYLYKYDNKDSFYFPDFYIPSLNLEIEVKDGGDNPNNHPKIIAVDKEKEKLKDDAVIKAKTTNYLKVLNKDNAIMLKYLDESKRRYLIDDTRKIHIF